MTSFFVFLFFFGTMLIDDYITFNASCAGSREQNIIHLCICIDIFFFLMNALVFRETFLEMSNPPCCYLQVKLSCSIICIFGFGFASHRWIDWSPSKEKEMKITVWLSLMLIHFTWFLVTHFFLDLYFKLFLALSWNESNKNQSSVRKSFLWIINLIKLEYSEGINMWTEISVSLIFWFRLNFKRCYMKCFLYT